MAIHICAEIGINHNGDVRTAMRLMEAAQAAGADSVKFQKRVPRLSVPRDQWEVPKETPWGTVEPYIDYKEKMELSGQDYYQLWLHAAGLNIQMAWSVWDKPSVDYVLQFDTPYIKVPSAKATDLDLLDYLIAHGGNRRLVVSTGMCNYAEVDEIVRHLSRLRPHPVLLHCTSTYPAPKSELNLACIRSYQERYPNLQVGYSGHEVGLATTVAAVAMGATWVERHITLDRSMKGTDHAASVEPQGFKRLVDDIRAVEEAIGDGIKRVMPGEIPVIAKLRGV